MPGPVATTPKFEKTDHHFVPRFWLRQFRSANNVLWKREGGQVSQAPLGGTMSEDWLYTVFNDKWEPSDALEDALSKFESVAGASFKTILASTSLPAESHWRMLLLFLALTACRHPEVMVRGGVLARDFAWNLADLPDDAEKEEYIARLKEFFGVDLPDAYVETLKQKPFEEIIAEVEEIEQMSPQDPRLPQQFALTGIIPVANAIALMDLDIVDAPAGQVFLLCDRPLPLKNLSHGFSVPLSKSVAFVATPTKSPTQHRRRASPTEVASINADQVARTNKVIVGPARGPLDALTI